MSFGNVWKHWFMILWNLLLNLSNDKENPLPSGLFSFFPISRWAGEWKPTRGSPPPALGSSINQKPNHPQPLLFHCIIQDCYPPPPLFANIQFFTPQHIKRLQRIPHQVQDCPNWNWIYIFHFPFGAVFLARRKTLSTESNMQIDTEMQEQEKWKIYGIFIYL